MKDTNLQVKIAKMETKMDTLVEAQDKNDLAHQTILNKMDDFISGCESKYVSKDRFRPVEKLAYGAAGAMLLAIIGALMVFLLK